MTQRDFITLSIGRDTYREILAWRGKMEQELERRVSLTEAAESLIRAGLDNT